MRDMAKAGRSLLFLELEPDDEDADVVGVVVLFRDELQDDDDDDDVAVTEADGWDGVRRGVCAGVRLAVDKGRRGGKDGAAWRAEWEKWERKPMGTRPGQCVSSAVWLWLWVWVWVWVWLWLWVWACEPASRSGSES